jgi:hypothetical protein
VDYLNDNDIETALSQLRNRCNSMAQADAEVVAGVTGRDRVADTAAAYNKALKRNGGPFATQAQAMRATQQVMELEWGKVARMLRAMLRVVAVFYPQSALFISIFTVLYDLWSAKNNGATGIASPA